MKTRVKSGPRAGGIISKGEVMELVRELHGYGLGSMTIAGMIGYHPSTVKHYNKLLGLPPMTTRERVNRIIERLPPEVAERAESVRQRAGALDLQRGIGVKVLDSPLHKRWDTTHIDETDAGRPGIEVL